MDSDEDSSGSSHFITWVGHFHPAMVVFPIAMLLAGALAELLRVATKALWLEGAARYCVIIAAVGGAIAAPLGWAFAIGHHESLILEWHRWLGTVGAGWLVALLVISEVSRRKAGGWRTAYLTGLFLAVPAVAAIGFLGGAMVYGLHEYDWNPPHNPETPTSAPTTTASSNDAKAVTVTMTDNKTFAPAAISIPVGTTVRWENRSKDTHTVTADAKRAFDANDVLLPAGAAPFDSGKIPPGGSYSQTFAVAGKYKYVCIPHEAMGMMGQVDVTSAK